MSMRRLVQVRGRWIAGPYVGRSGTLTDVRAGLVYGVLWDGTRTLGPPHDFQAESGESGGRLLDILLPRPPAFDLFVGMIRESLASVRSTAVFGRQDTRAWETPHRYIVDDGEGNVAAVDLVGRDIVGAICSHDPARRCERHVEAAPAAQRASLASLLELPLLRSGARGVSAAFWTEDGRLQSPESWFETYSFGGEIFRRELLDEASWRYEGAVHHDLDDDTATTMIDISNRAVPSQRVELSEQELERVLPFAAPHWREGDEQLFGGGMFARKVAQK